MAAIVRTHHWMEPAGRRAGSMTRPGWSGCGSELKVAKKRECQMPSSSAPGLCRSSSSPMSPRCTRQCWQMYEHELGCGVTMPPPPPPFGPLLMMPSREDLTRHGRSTLKTLQSSCNSYTRRPACHVTPATSNTSYMQFIVLKIQSHCDFLMLLQKSGHQQKACNLSKQQLI